MGHLTQDRQGVKGRAMELEPGLRLLRAPNAGPMTADGTNTYLIGDRDVAVIDPGPADPAHLRAILGAISPGARITAILVTHAHRDHSSLAGWLAEATGAPVCAAGPADWGRAPRMAALAAAGIGGGEGVDVGFVPTRKIADGETVVGSDWQITAVASPGHMANNLAFAWRGALFTGDVVMGWASSLISPPDGDMTAFYATLDRFAARADRVYYPGHGDPVGAPRTRVAELRDHRLARETAIRAALAAGTGDVTAITAAVYTDIPKLLIPMAERNTFAHLIDLLDRNLVTIEGPLTLQSQFSAVAHGSTSR